MAARPKGSKKKTNAKPSRPVDDGIGRHRGVRGSVPGMRYSLITLAGTAVDEHIDMGWEPVLWDLDSDGKPRGPHILSGRRKDRKSGNEIKALDHLLMEISEERWQKIQQFGAFGDAGQALADDIARRIKDPNYERPTAGLEDVLQLQAEPGHSVNA